MLTEGRDNEPTLGMNATLRFRRPWTNSSSSCSSSSKSPVVLCVSPCRLADRVVISNSRLRPHAGCYMIQSARNINWIEIVLHTFDSQCINLFRIVAVSVDGSGQTLTSHRDSPLGWSVQWGRRLKQKVVTTGKVKSSQVLTVYESIPGRHGGSSGRFYRTTDDHKFLKRLSITIVFTLYNRSNTQGYPEEDPCW